jgi:hypothetical protein
MAGRKETPKKQTFLKSRAAPLNRADREKSLERAKAIGRIAYRVARSANLVGVLEIEGEEKHLREFRHGRLFIDLYEPFRLPVGAEFSRLRTSYDAKRVLEIRWDGAGTFNVVRFEETVEWIGWLALARRIFSIAPSGKSVV